MHGCLGLFFEEVDLKVHNGIEFNDVSEIEATKNPFDYFSKIFEQTKKGTNERKNKRTSKNKQ